MEKTIQTADCWSPNKFFVISEFAFSDINKGFIGELQKGHGCRLAVVAFLLATQSVCCPLLRAD